MPPGFVQVLTWESAFPPFPHQDEWYKLHESAPVLSKQSQPKTEVYRHMAINSNFNISQQNYSLNLQNQVRDSGKNAANQLVNQGATNVTKQQTSQKQVSEQSTLSEAARKALEADELKQAQEQGGAKEAGKAAGKAKAKEREKTKDGSGDLRGAGESRHYAPGEMQKMPDGSTVVHGDDETPTFEIGPTGSKRLAQMDDANFTRATVVDTMPAHAKAVAGKMVEEKTDTGKKREKFADLKMGDAKFSDQVEGVILKLTSAMDPRGEVGVASIRTPKHEPPRFEEDPHAESIMKEHARTQLANGSQNEAFVA